MSINDDPIYARLAEAWHDVAAAIPDPNQVHVARVEGGWGAWIQLSETAEIKAVAQTLPEAMSALANAYSDVVGSSVLTSEGLSGGSLSQRGRL